MGDRWSPHCPQVIRISGYPGPWFALESPGQISVGEDPVPCQKYSSQMTYIKLGLQPLHSPWIPKEGDGVWAAEMRGGGGGQQAELLILSSCPWSRLAGPVPNRQQAEGKSMGDVGRNVGPFSNSLLRLCLLLSPPLS